MVTSVFKYVVSVSKVKTFYLFIINLTWNFGAMGDFVLINVE
jgi:hypothetical protein